MIKKQTMIFPFSPAQVRRALIQALEHGTVPLLEYKGYDEQHNQMDLLHLPLSGAPSHRVHIGITAYTGLLTTVEVCVFCRMGHIDWDASSRLINSVFNAISANAAAF